MPSRLRPGDKIVIVAPGRKIKQDEISLALQIFKSWGLEVITSPNLHSEQHSYLAGTDHERLTDLQSSLNDPTIKAIIAARGGYGSTRILDLVDFSGLDRYPKWIVGFSDITAIHLKLLRCGLASIHGTMPILFPKEDSTSSIDSLKNVLLDGHCSIKAEATSDNRKGETQGVVVGGNLSLIVDSLGTSSELNTDNKILIIEEIDEYLYRIDRMFTQLKRAGKLKNLAGLIVGHMTSIKDSELRFGESTTDIIMNAVKEYAFPVAFNFPTGHENPNLAWVHGGKASFKVNSHGAILDFKDLQ